MTMQRLGIGIYVTGLVLMVGDVIYGKQIQSEVSMLGLVGLQAKYGNSGILKLLLFAFSFPLGVGISLLGAALLGGTANSRVGRIGAVSLLLVLVPLFVPGIFGTQASPAYFGYGGMAILVLVASAFWFWGQYRLGLAQTHRAAVDLQGLGLLSFALAAWNLCGFAGMPGFAVYPEKMLGLAAVWFAVGQLKAVMALLVLGWIFTALGFYQAARTTRQ